MKKMNYSILTLALTSMLPLSFQSQAGALEGTNVKYGGYVKLDALWSDYSDGAIGGTSIGRDFYVPSTTPVGDGSADSDVVFDMHARQSRFFFATDTKLDNGKQIKSKIELDFIVTPGGNERVSNSYTSRIRQAFIQYDGWLIGQAWSNFQNVGALPETLDFIGPAEGTVFVRQPMIRYSSGNFSFSLENPESTITTAGGVRNETDDASLPDFTARYTHKADWGQLVVAGIGRQLTYKTGAADATESSFGISVSGKVNTDSGNIKFMLTQGSGLGRYVALNAAHGGVYDPTNDSIEAIDSTSGFIAYQHNWTDKVRSTFLYSFFNADNERELLGITGNPTKSTQSYSANLLYSPAKKLTFGAELKFAEREVEDGTDGDLTRLQFSAKYVF